MKRSTCNLMKKVFLLASNSFFVGLTCKSQGRWYTLAVSVATTSCVGVLQVSEDVHRLGYPIENIGTHSIHKGAISYLSAAPGGPQAAAVCVHAGWMMGKVKDIYMRYIDSGDQFVGRCLVLLLLLDSKFACSPPHFPSTTTDED